MRCSILTAVLLATLGAIVPSAHAAPNWQTPSVAAAEGQAPAVAVDQAGNVYIAYITSDAVKVAQRAPGGAFAPGETIASGTMPQGPYAPIAIDVDSAGNVTAAWIQDVAGASDPVLFSATRPAGGAWGPRQVVDAQVMAARGFSLSVGDTGLTAIAYATGSFGQERLTVTLRQPGAPTWSAPEKIGTPGITDTPRVDVGADGTVAATAGLYGAGPRGVVRPSVTGVWGPEEDLDPPPPFQGHLTAPSVAVDPGGGVLTAWTHAIGGDDYQIATRYRPGGAATAFGPAELLPNLDGAAYGTEFFNGPALAFDASGNATMVWRQYMGDSENLYGATRPAGGPFGAPEAIATGGGAQFARLAIDAAGTALVVWRGADDRSHEQDPAKGTGPVFATSRPAGGSFAAPDLLAPFSSTTPAVDASAAGVGAATWGRPLPEGCSQIESALWSEGPAGPFPAVGRACTAPSFGTPPPPPQTPPPLPRDAIAPRAKVSATSRQRVLKTKAVTLKLACDEDCSARIAAQVDHKPARRQKKVKALKLSSKVVAGPAGKSVTVKFRVTKRQLATLKKMLAKKGKATFTAKVAAADSTGNTSKTTRKIVLLP